MTAFRDDPHLSGAPMQRALGIDPAAMKLENEKERGISDSITNLLFKCRKCRRPLARDSSLLPHAPGRGKAFGTNSHVLNRSLDVIKRRGKSGGGRPSAATSDYDDCNDACQEGLFFEPIEWMREQILYLEGQLTCPKPKCGAKLGHFNWVGQPCPCGHWVVPAFHLAASKVDKCVIEPAGAGLRFGVDATTDKKTISDGEKTPAAIGATQNVDQNKRSAEEGNLDEG